MLEKRGAVLETARRVSHLLRDNKINGAIIGGVAVVLHGHVRTTKDVDVFINEADSISSDPGGRRRGI
jgi:predicted nucleotidyltransferase